MLVLREAVGKNQSSYSILCEKTQVALGYNLKPAADMALIPSVLGRGSSGGVLTCRAVKSVRGRNSNNPFHPRS